VVQRQQGRASCQAEGWLHLQQGAVVWQQQGHAIVAAAALCGEGIWQSNSAMPVPAAPPSSAYNASLDASLTRLNIDSPQNTCPTRTPYTPPTNTSPCHISTLWAWPS
jgi:hypothetical protein